MEQHTSLHLCGIVFFILLAGIRRSARSAGILPLAVWNLAGTILHETAHLLVGVLFRAKPTGFSLVPRRQGRPWRLGSVSFTRITPLNAVPVALAPLGLAVIAYWFARRWFVWWSPSLGTTLSLYAVLYLLLSGALPSRGDLEVACTWRSLLLYAVLGAGVWYGKSLICFR